MRAEQATLEQRIDYRFADPELLCRALTHSSLANEARVGGLPVLDNEQFEFLGDSVLGFVITDALVRRHPNQTEGELSLQKSHLVSAAHLHGVARRLDLGAFLHIGRSEELGGGRKKKTLLVGALEALIGAMYLDTGVEPCRRFVHSFVLDAPPSSDEDAGTDIKPAIQNFKTALQDLAVSRKLPLPRYNVVAERGPGHAKVFTVEVRLSKDWTGQADGRTKKIAAQRAARGVYERLLQQDQPAEASLPD